MSAAQPTSVLVVEDDPLVRLFVIQALRDAGYRAEEAASADEARRLLERRRYDVLMTDVALAKGQDGFALAAWAAHRRPGLRIVYSTGLPDVQHGMRARGSFLAKPFGTSRLLRSIEAASGRASIAAAA